MHLKAKPSEPGTGTPDNEGWLYCLKKGQARTPKLPYFDWTGYISMCFSPFYFILIFVRDLSLMVLMLGIVCLIFRNLCIMDMVSARLLLADSVGWN